MPTPGLCLMPDSTSCYARKAIDKLVFTDNAVGPNVVEGVGYPKISRLSPDRPWFPVQNGDTGV